ncbi:pentapeptide repeat-containing protein [Citrobacter braakii]|uniref:pentapeptide repeat-containing protein n=1 Tax=Citrobacter braakii TaxID=57706 RepID=UPI00351D879B
MDVNPVRSVTASRSTEETTGLTAASVRAAIETWQNETAPGEERTTVAARLLRCLENAEYSIQIRAPVTTLPALLPPTLTELVLDGCTALRDISHLPAGLEFLSVVECTSLEAISTPLPKSISDLLICHCPVLARIEGELPQELHRMVYVNGCTALDETQRAFLSYPVDEYGRLSLGRAELLADIRYFSAHGHEGESVTERNFSGCGFADSDLHGFILSGIDISDADFRRAYLTGVRLTQAAAKKCNFSSATLTDAVLDFSILDQSNFTGATLTGVSLYETSINGTDFTNASLERAQMGGASFNENYPVVTGANFKNAVLCPGMSLKGAVLGTADNSPAPSASLIRLADAWLPVPEEWDREAVELFLDNANRPELSLLKTIDSMDDQYAGEKVRTAERLVRTLQSSGVDVSCVGLYLLETLGKPDYHTSPLIQEWLVPFSDAFFSSNIDVVNSPGSWLGSTVLAYLMAEYFVRHPEKMQSHNGAFIKTMLQGMYDPKVSCPDLSLICQEIYTDYYLPTDAVALYTRQDDFGKMDGSGEPDWESKDAFNWVLLSSPEENSIMVVSDNSLSKMFGPDFDTHWRSFFLYRDGELQGASGYQLDHLFNDVFPVFRKAYQSFCSAHEFGRILDILLPEGEVKEQFRTAALSGTSDVKMVDDDSQLKLGEIFEPYLDDWLLQEGHIQQITDCYELQEVSDSDKAEIFFCLGAAFCRYSSSAVFGTEWESPQVLRSYASGLLEEAHRQHPALFAAEDFTPEECMNDIRGRLRGGDGGHFTCTAVLSDILVEHAEKNFPQRLVTLYPVAWR